MIAFCEHCGSNAEHKVRIRHAPSALWGQVPMLETSVYLQCRECATEVLIEREHVVRDDLLPAALAARGEA